MTQEKILISQFKLTLENLFKNYYQQFHDKKIGVFASGGIDSSIIAYFTKIFFKKITLFTLHSEKGVDLEYTKLLNQKLKQDLQIININNQKITEIKDKVLKLLKEKNIDANPTQLSLASAFYLLCQNAKEQGIEVIFTGQGPDILLAGYHMYQKIPLEKLNEKIKNDLYLLQIDKTRDNAVAQLFGLQLINPYLEKEFIDFAIKIPPNFKMSKIKDEVYEKYISRKLAELLDLPEKIILRHKKALQYSTKIRRYF